MLNEPGGHPGFHGAAMSIQDVALWVLVTKVDCPCFPVLHIISILPGPLRTAVHDQGHHCR